MDAPAYEVACGIAQNPRAQQQLAHIDVGLVRREQEMHTGRWQVGPLDLVL